MLDAGCRDAAHLIRLVQRCGGSGVGIDPVAIHAARGAGGGGRKGSDRPDCDRQGVMDNAPQLGRRFGLVWCRDVLEPTRRFGAWRPTPPRRCCTATFTSGTSCGQVENRGSRLTLKDGEAPARGTHSPSSLDDASSCSKVVTSTEEPSTVFNGSRPPRRLTLTLPWRAVRRGQRARTSTSICCRERGLTLSSYGSWPMAPDLKRADPSPGLTCRRTGLRPFDRPTDDHLPSS